MARALTDSKRKLEERLRKKVYAVQLYYGKLPHLPQPLTQSEIAKRIGTSTSQVSLLLKEAQQEGLVEVSIHTPRSYLLEGELIHAYGRYGLRQARVAVVGDPDMEAAVIDAIGDCAARYVEESLESGSKIGIGGGRTARSLVDHLRPGELPELEIYPMESVGPVHVSANTIAANMAAISEQVSAFALPVPPLTSGTLDDARIILDYFLTLEPIAKVYDSLEELDVAIVGMASLSDPDSIERDASYYGVDLDIIESISERAVGNVLWQFFDENGNIVDSELHQRVISVTLDQLREMSRSPKKTVIGIAGGKYKAGVIKAAIVGGFIDTIITDIDTGEQLLEMAG
jgi:DNA-binding transcriptional regulator LsrR (DeoR family)